jgi:hypothetical protein
MHAVGGHRAEDGDQDDGEPVDRRLVPETATCTTRQVTSASPVTVATARSPTVFVKPTRWMKKSEVVSPIPVVRILMIQK